MADFPFYHQHDSMDCGAACIRMIARHYGRYHSLEYLRELTYVDREGVSLSSISDAAEHIGFHTLAINTSYEELVDHVPLPCIAYWNQQHFVVVYRVTKSYVWIADPEHGKVSLTKEEFIAGWTGEQNGTAPTGILLLFEVTPDFKRNEEDEINRGGLVYLWSYFRRYKKLIRQLLLGLVLTSIIQLLFPFLMQAIIDNGVLDQDFNFVLMVLIAQVVLFVSYISVEAIRSWILLHIGSRTSISMVSVFLMKLMRLPIRYFDSKYISDILQRIYDNERVERFLSATTLMTVFSIFTFIVFGFVLWYYSSTIFTIYTAITFLYVAWITFFLKWRKNLDYRRFQQVAENQNTMIELVKGMKEIKLHNAEKQKRWAWERTQSQLFRASIDYLKIDQIQRTGAAFLNEGKNIFITVIAAKAVIDNQMSLGQLVAIQYIVGQLNAPLVKFVEFIRDAQDARISLERMNEIHTQEDEEQIEEKVTIIPEYGDLHLENLSFRYGGPNATEILKNINIHIPKGKTTAIVGTSGSGKTTILKLLLNFYRPTGGSLRLGEISLHNIHSKLWRSKVGAVMPDEFIFSDTIARNIALGDEIINTQKLLKAARVANIQPFVDGLPLGYNTRIGEDGMGLSQGQKQRILIARAVYKDPEYILFDEATNALDAYQEMLIMENLEAFFYGKTVVIVAHRLSTVMNADNIVVLEKGEIVEQGRHHELIAAKGAYYYLIRNQLELGV
ncbi:MAG: peptidase domain-containing ABC transporter [Bacteroidota bacterium]